MDAWYTWYGDDGYHCHVKENPTIQENHFKLGTKELCISTAEKCAISVRGLTFKISNIV